MDQSPNQSCAARVILSLSKLVSNPAEILNARRASIEANLNRSEVILSIDVDPADPLYTKHFEAAKLEALSAEFATLLPLITHIEGDTRKIQKQFFPLFENW